LKATRIQGSSFGLIDHIVTNQTMDNVTSGVIISDISDHFFTFNILDWPTKSPTQEFITKRNFSLENLRKFKQALSSVNWNLVTNLENVDTSYDKFWEIFSLHYENSFPLVKMKRNKNFHKINNFMTEGLLISRVTKNNLHKAAIVNPSEFNWNYYRTYRNLYNCLIKKSRNLYFTNGLNENQKNPKKTWELLGEAINKQKQDSKIPEINDDGNILFDDKDKANAFNHFFANVANNVNKSIPATSTDPEHYLTNMPDSPPLLQFDELGPVYISDIIKILPSKASADLQGVSLKIIKFVRTEICTPLAHIFNLSISSGIFPSALKCSRTVPVFKNGSKSLCDNYRPISLVPTFSKLLEKIVATKLTNHLELNNLLYKHQYGFQRGKQTEHNLIHLLNYVGDAINSNKFCIGIFLDIKKAFDCVNREILFKKLYKLGIRGMALNWFQSYLSGRTQKCDINGKISDGLNIDIGVLQGSTLGPILFLCFINDFPSSTSLLSLLFADDTACLAADANLNNLFETVNSEIQKVATWFKANKLAVNVKKTKYLLFHTKQKKIDLGDLKILYDDNDLDSPPDPSKVTELGRITISNDDPQDRTYKYLGILLDEHLSFDQHINYLAAKLSKSLYFVSKVKNILPKKALLNLYYALIHPHFLYCSNIYSCTGLSNIRKLEVLQKKAVRIINHKKSNFPTKDLFLTNGILPLRDLILYNKACFMHSVYYNYSPPTFSESFICNPPGHDHDLRQINNFHIPRPRIDWYKKMPLFDFPQTWNNLEEAKLYRNRKTFQIMLKGRLIQSRATAP